jgi:Spy/CpxP family protein refolding chaperone
LLLTVATFASGADPSARQQATPVVDSPQAGGLTRKIIQLRARIAQIQVRLEQNRRSESFGAGVQPVGMPIDDEMGKSAAADKLAMNSKGMPKGAGCCSEMMGKRGSSGSTTTTTPSALPGLPGTSHLYHVGATGFFLDYATAIKLTVDQQTALNEIKEKATGDLAAAQRQIDQAEQELWMLTSSEQPDSMTLEMKVRDIDSLKGDQRIAFIRSVGEAARVLTDGQRSALLGTSSPRAAQTSGAMGDM